jgi:hypothetical protein
MLVRGTNRRAFIAGLGSTAALPLTGRAQTSERVPVIGYLGLNASSPVHAAFKRPFVRCGMESFASTSLKLGLLHEAAERSLSERFAILKTLGI